MNGLLEMAMRKYFFERDLNGGNIVNRVITQFLLEQKTEIDIIKIFDFYLKMIIDYEQSLIDYVVNENCKDIENDDFRGKVSEERKKEICGELGKEIILEYAEYIRNNLQKLNEQLHNSRKVVYENMTALYSKVEGLEMEDPKHLSKRKKLVIQGLKNLPGIPLKEQTGCFLYLESMANESIELREFFTTPLNQAKEKLVFKLAQAIKEQSNYRLLTDLEKLSKDELVRSLNVMWGNKTFDQIYESAIELTNICKLEKNQLGSYIKDFIMGQEQLFQLTNLDKFISSYLEMQEFIKKSWDILDRKQRSELNNRWQMKTYFNLRYVKRFANYRSVDITNAIAKSTDINETLNRLARLWSTHFKIIPLYVKFYELFTEAFYCLVNDKAPLIEGITNKFKTLDLIKNSFEVFEIEYLIYDAIKDIHQNHRREFMELIRESKMKIRDQVFSNAISAFKELKLSETPMAISEKISLAFNPITELSNFITIEDIGAILDSYMENAKTRMASCKKAYASLQKIKASDSEHLINLDPKIFAVRLEAEAAFINKYLAGLKNLKNRKIQDFNSLSIFQVG